MQLRPGHLTTKERIFVEHFASTDDGHYAAEKAGYGNIRDSASKVPNRPRLAGPLAEARELLQTKGARVGVKGLIRLAKDDPKNPPGVQRAASSDLVKYSGVAAVEDAMRKELHEMTLEELDKRRQQLMAERADNAKVIDHDPGHIAQSVPNIFD